MRREIQLYSLIDWEDSEPIVWDDLLDKDSRCVITVYTADYAAGDGIIPEGTKEGFLLAADRIWDVIVPGKRLTRSSAQKALDKLGKFTGTTYRFYAEPPPE